MEKSIDLIIEDTKQEMANILNKSGLPITIILLLLKDVCYTVDVQAKVSLEKQREKYVQEVKESGNK